MNWLARLGRRVAGYAAHEDPLTNAANWVAIVVAWNQPFYPLYLWAVVGGDKVWPALLTFLSTPFFLAVPAVAKRHSIAARIMLPVTGIANGILSAKAFGVGSGVEIFLLPCALLGTALFRPQERAAGLIVVALSAAAYLVPARVFGQALAEYTAADNSGMASLNAASAAVLVVFIGLLLAEAFSTSERSSVMRREENSGSTKSPEPPPSR